MAQLRLGAPDVDVYDMASAVRWVWERPREGVEFIGRSVTAVLFIACVTNTLLVWSSRDDDWFTWVITISAGIAAAGILTRIVYRVTVVSEYGVWLACGMWVANLVEIATSDVSTSGKLRNGGFYFAFAFLSANLYTLERIVLRVERDELE